MNEYYIVDPQKLKSAVSAIMRGEGVPSEDAVSLAIAWSNRFDKFCSPMVCSRVKFYTDSIEQGGTDRLSAD